MVAAIVRRTRRVVESMARCNQKNRSRGDVHFHFNDSAFAEAATRASVVDADGDRQ
jgi:hypothetical protein